MRHLNGSITIVFYLLCLKLYAQENPRWYPPSTLTEYCKLVKENKQPKYLYGVTSFLKSNLEEAPCVPNEGKPDFIIPISNDAKNILGNGITIYHYFKSKEEYERIKSFSGRGNYNLNIAFAEKLFRTKFELGSNISYPGLYFSLNPFSYKNYGRYLLILKIKQQKYWRYLYSDEGHVFAPVSFLLHAENAQIDFALGIFPTSNGSPSAGVLINFEAITSFQVHDRANFLSHYITKKEYKSKKCSFSDMYYTHEIEDLKHYIQTECSKNKLKELKKILAPIEKSTSDEYLKNRIQLIFKFSEPETK
jgi:hypothetical protein